MAHLLGQQIAGKWQPRAPLSGRQRRQAQEEVRLRKALRPPTPEAPALRQRPAPGGVRGHPPHVTCSECGTAIPGRSRRYCPACGVLLPGFDDASRARRGRGIAASRAELERWRQEHPEAEARGPRGARSVGEDAERFRYAILPGLAGVPLREIMDALGCAKSTASLIRSGRHLPALRHWPKLAELGSRRDR